MNGMKVLTSFGFMAEKEPVSIYPFSPVYRIKGDKRDLIVKKTQSPLERAHRLIKYTAYLQGNGIPVVTPISIGKENPQTVGEDTYVVYPFIEGPAYSGEDAEIIKAGELLGRIQALSPEGNTFDLPEYDVFDFTVDEVEESIQNIEIYVTRHHCKIDTVKLKEKLLQIVSQQDEIRDCGLPYTATPHDYKANNLIYQAEPCLIDPDNATWIPRVFDIALALLLFHNELKTAPDTIFTPEQWQLFLQGYKKSICLTELEQSYWQKAVEHVFLDEVMWLMADVEEDWDNQSQRTLFESLTSALLDLEDYQLG